ncbi:hypothetical protein BJV77DRAFT_1124385 [Russula vinacea]|nr:hypothetical protein BJV77DRAFT_1124385 [Russula vinacea]
MSHERRTPFALIHPNARPTDSVLHPNSAPPQLPISRPRRQMPAYHQPHQQYNPHKRYATHQELDGAASAQAQRGGGRSGTRAREVGSARGAREDEWWTSTDANPADPTTATHTNSATTAATTTTTVRNGARIRRYSRDQEHGLSMDMGKGREKENDESISMQVDGYEKPLPPRPAPLMFALHKFPEQGPLSAPARMPAANSAMMAMAMATSSPMMVDSREESGSTPHNNDDAGAGAREGERLPTSDSTLRTTPTSLTCFETTESQVLQRRPTRAVTPPQVRRRPSITDELEEAREEATLAMLHTSRTDGLIRCPRRGCDSLLGGVRALTFHLHIHAVGAGAYACLRCGGAFETARELTRHACARRRAKDRLRSVVRAWTCLSSTSPGFGKEQQPWQPQQQHPSKHYKRKDYY